jgi:hypothetical protein
MSFQTPPATACWQHQGLRDGFEVAYFTREPAGLRVEGASCGLQDGETWVVSYHLTLDDSWRTRRVQFRTLTAAGWIESLVESDGAGHWSIDGEDVAHLGGCLDIDLEASALTNALPVHRLGLDVGESAAAPAAYVRVAGTSVERLDQLYVRVEDRAGAQCFDYAAPAFDFTCRLVYDEYGLVVDYPGIAKRAG